MTAAYDAWLRSLVNAYTRDSYTRKIKLFLVQVNKPLNQITRNDVVRFVNSYATWNNRHMALAAVKSFLSFALKRPPNLTGINIGEKPDPTPIAEPTAEELARFQEVVDNYPLGERTAIKLLFETGHRRRAILDLPREAVQMRPGGPVVAFPPRTQKKGTSPVAPISKTTYDLLMQLLASHKDPLVFKPVAWKQSGKWLYTLVKRAAREAGITVRTYPHLFRHLKALEFRRKGVKEDTVINTLGWRDATVFNSRYGRRQAFETAEEARSYLPEVPKGPPEPQPTTKDSTGHIPAVAEVIRELAQLLKEGKMDLTTYQASLAALVKRPDRERNSIQGYG
jgi:integrase